MARVHSLDSFHQRQPLPLGPIGQQLLSPTSVAHWPVEVSMGSTFGAAGTWFHIGVMYVRILTGFGASLHFPTFLTYM